MGKKACEICRREANAEDLVIHHVIPEEIASQVGILDTRTVLLCIDCSHKFQAFCSSKVHDLRYDDIAQRFIHKSPAELIKEYEVAYKAFVAYTKWR